MAIELTKEAIQHIVERPKHLDLMAEMRGSLKIAKIAQSLKLIDKTKALQYDLIEFQREFSANKGYLTYFKKKLKFYGIKKPHVIKDDGKVYIWKNDD